MSNPQHTNKNRKNIALAAFSAVAALGLYLFNPLYLTAITGAVGGYLSANAPTRDKAYQVKLQMVVGQTIFGAHLYLLDAHSGAIVAGVTAGRALIQAGLKDEWKVAKTGTAVLGFAAAAGLYLVSQDVNNLSDFKNTMLDLKSAPLLAMLLAGIAETLSTKHIQRQRKIYMGAAATQCVYHAFESGSPFGFLINAWSFADTGFKLKSNQSLSQTVHKKLNVTFKKLRDKFMP